MGIAALVIGIIGLILSFIPVVNVIFFVPIVIGFVLGIVDTVLKTKKKQPRGIAISGIVLTSVALVISIFMNLVALIALIKVGSELITDGNLNEIIQNIETEKDNHNYNYDDYTF